MQILCNVGSRQRDSAADVLSGPARSASCDEVPSKAEAGRSPPERPEASQSAEPPALPQQPSGPGAPLPLARRSPLGNNSAANAARKPIQRFDLLWSHLGNGCARAGEAPG